MLYLAGRQGDWPHLLRRLFGIPEQHFTSSGPSILVLRIYLTVYSYPITKDMCIRIFIVALFAVDKNLYIPMGMAEI